MNSLKYVITENHITFIFNGNSYTLNQREHPKLVEGIRTKEVSNIIKVLMEDESNKYKEMFGIDCLTSLINILRKN